MYLNSKYIGIWYFCWIPMYLGCMVLGTYIGNAWFRAFPMYYCTSFSRRYIGIEISMPIPMYGGSNLSRIYIGMGQYRLFPMYRQKLPKQNTSETQKTQQFRCMDLIEKKKYIGNPRNPAIPMYLAHQGCDLSNPDVSGLPRLWFKQPAIEFTGCWSPFPRIT